MSISEFMFLWEMESLQEAKAEGREGSWWVKWILKRVVLFVLQLVFILPVRFIWRLTGNQGNEFVHFVKWAVFSIIYYFILYVLITLPFSGQ